MCHSIRQEKNSFFLLSPAKGSVRYIGMKEFFLDLEPEGEIKLLPRFMMSQEYKVLSSVSLKDCNNEKQPLCISISVVDSRGCIYNTSKQLKCRAGIHISPFYKEDSLAIPSSHSSLIQSSVINIPVLFSMEDVLFFDGRNVSVTKLSIIYRKMDIKRVMDLHNPGQGSYVIVIQDQLNQIINLLKKSNR